MSVFRRGNTWVAKFQLRGEQHWVPGGPWTTKRQAEEAERRHRDRLDARRHSETCASFAERWLEEWPRPQASTRKLYAQAAQRFAEEFGPTPLGEVERLSARTWALGVPRNLSKIIGTMYEDARNVGLVEANPFSNLRLPVSEKTEEIQAPTLEEYRRLLDACTVLGGHGTEFRAMIQFAAWTGIRAGELHAMSWNDVDGDHVWVRRSRKTDGSIGRPKNGRERKIVLLPPARVLDQVPRRDDGFVFHTARGEPLQKGNHHYGWRAVRAASGIAQERAENGQPDIRWHDLRHFCATQLLEMGLDHSPSRCSSATRTAAPWSCRATGTLRRRPLASGYYVPSSSTSSSPVGRSVATRSPGRMAKTFGADSNPVAPIKSGPQPGCRFEPAG